MEFETILTAISTVGFPCAVCLIMIYLNEKQDERHYTELNELKKTIENNTLALTKLSEHVDD